MFCSNLQHVVYIRLYVMNKRSDSLRPTMCLCLDRSLSPHSFQTASPTPVAACTADLIARTSQSLRYGAQGVYTYRDAATYGDASGNVSCSNSVFGDPIYGVVKSCWCAPQAAVQCPNVATVTCANTPADEGAVRLVNGPSISAGRVEIFHAGQWGTVCDDYWDVDDANAVCRQMGFTSGVPLSRASFGEGSGPIWLDDVSCFANNTGNLSMCSNPGWGVNNCAHSEDAAVVCASLTLSALTSSLSGTPTWTMPAPIPNPGYGGAPCPLGQHRVECGSGTSSATSRCHEIATCSPDSTQNELRCCADVLPSPSTGWVYNHCQTPSSLWVSSLSSWSNLNFTQALQTCANAGGRLCTAAEINNMCAQGSGAGFDDDLVWTSDGGTTVGFCASGFSAPAAAVVCQQLGFTGGDPNYNLSSSGIGLTSLQCVGTEQDVSQCSAGPVAASCPLAGVICAQNLRLVNGNTPNEGRLEIFADGQWGTVRLSLSLSLSLISNSPLYTCVILAPFRTCPLFT